jgi:D-alanyl-D-alanine carboxypeptidase
VPVKAAPPVADAPPVPQPAQRPAVAAVAREAGVPVGIAMMRVRPVLARAPEPASETPPHPALGDVQPEADAAAAAPPEVALPRRNAPAPGVAPAGPFQVQIGAFETRDEAERHLAWAWERAGTVLAARYGGFGAQSAAAGVCTALKRLDIDCLVMKAQ